MKDDDIDSEQFSPSMAFAFLTKTDSQIAKELNKGDEKEEPVLEENEMPDGETRGKKTTLVNRLFSKMEAGSLRGSIFAMSSLALGTGCLTLPMHFEEMSFLTALVVLILGSLAAYWSLTLLIKACAVSRIYDYSQLVKNVWGKGPALFLDINILLYIIGILISYQVISN
jgi:hypothetical protein